MKVLRSTIWASIVSALLGLSDAATATAAPPPLDSAKAAAAERRVAEPATADTTRLRLLRALSRHYYTSNAASSKRYAEQGLRLARRLNQPDIAAALLFTLSSQANQVSNDAAAISYNKQLIELSPRLSDKVQWRVSEAYKGLAGVELNRADYPAARRYYQLATEWSERYPAPHDTIPGSSRAWAGIGMLDYYAAQMQNGNTTDSILRGVERYARRALAFDLAHPKKRRYTLPHAYMSLANVSSKRGHLDSAVARYSLAIREHQTLDDVMGEATARGFLADVLLRKGQTAADTAEAEKAVGLNTQAGAPVAEVYVTWASALAAAGQYPQAYQIARRAKVVSDSITLATGAEEVARLRVQLDTELKDSRIKTLTTQRRLQEEQAHRQQQRLWALAGILLAVVLGLGVAAFLALRLRRSRAQLAAQNEQLAAQRDTLAVQRDELTQARATQDRLYALIAHDLRSPVVAFAGLADLLNRYVTKGDTARLAGLGDRIRQAAQNLRELLDNLLNWAVSQRGELVARPRPVRATELLAGIAALYQNAALAADISLTTDAEGEGGATAPELLVQADPDMTRTILRNLAGNALKATPAGGRVALHVHRQTDGFVQLRVTDSGTGLTAEHLARLNGAAPAMRVAGRDSGAGLGLLLSRSFAEAQGGTLVLRAGASGSTEATLTLPMAA